MPLIPVIGFLVLAERGVNLWNAHQAAEDSKALYEETKHFARRNIQYRKKCYEYVRKHNYSS